MPKVLNKRTASREELAGAVYIGRPSKWGNPFVIGRDGTRDEVVTKHRLWLQSSGHRDEIERELRGKNLVCFCAPEACHGDTLLQIANYDWSESTGTAVDEVYDFETRGR